MTVVVSSFNQASAELNKYIPKAMITAPYSLDTISALMSFLDNPQDKIRVIHVAGTSGKTSTAYYTAALLEAAGHTVGLTVSPHVNNVGDRAQINLMSLPEDEYCQELSLFLNIVEQSNLQPSYFELLVGFAFWLFHKRGVDYAVVEVGLGGLLDGTNVINRSDKICVITDIGIDHTKLLGNTTAEIAWQKAGIIKPSNTVFIYHQPSGIMSQVEKKCELEKANLHVIEPVENVNNLDTLPLFQKRNIFLAIQAVNYALIRDFSQNLSDNQIKLATKTLIPGRMEVTKFRGKDIILDGSHNEQKIGALVESIRQQYPGQNLVLMVGFGNSEKSNMLEKMRLLRQLGSTIIITKFSKGQDEIRISVKPEVLAETARQAGFIDIIIEQDPIHALQKLADKITNIGLVTGSFYLLMQVRPEIVKI